MKICGIISEYNPFHKGHIYHIEQSRLLTGCDTIISIMSGNFVQRGEPAVLSKFERAKMAINYADAVIELPCAFSLSSAEDFAFYAVKMLDNIGADYLSFGSECGDLELLKEIATFLYKENKEFKKNLKVFLKQGCSFAAAKTKLIEQNFSKNAAITEVINKPNNLLAIEYLKALLKLKSKIIPATIKRLGNYNDEKIKEGYASASAVRKLIGENKTDVIKKHMDESSFNILIDNINKYGFLNEKTLSDLICYKIKTTGKEELKKINGITEGLENRFIEFSNLNNLEKLLEAVKTKRYLHSKLKRVCMNILLDIDNKTITKAKKIKPYFKILALKERKDILSHLANRKCLVIARFKDYHLIKHRILKKLIAIDIKSTEIHNMLFKNRNFNDYSNNSFKNF